MTDVTPTDRPKSVRNHCVINVLVAFLCFHVAFWIFCECRGFCHRTESDFFPFFLLFWRVTRLSNKLLEQGYVSERLKTSFRKFYCRYGDLSKQYEVPLSRILNHILKITLYTMTTLQRSDFIKLWPFYRTWPFTEFWEVCIEHLWRVWHADRGHYPSGNLVPSHLGLASDLPVGTNHFSELVIFPEYSVRRFLRTFSILLRPILEKRQ